MSNLRDQIQGLSPAEKIELLDALWESLEAGGTSLTANQQAELNLRLNRYGESPANVVPWQQVRTKLFKES